jgi:hypothetical protein
MRSIVILNAHQISGDQMKKNEIGGACEHCVGCGEARAVFWWGILKESDQLEYVSVDRKITSMFIFTKLDGKA